MWLSLSRPPVIAVDPKNTGANSYAYANNSAAQPRGRTTLVTSRNPLQTPGPVKPFSGALYSINVKGFSIAVRAHPRCRYQREQIENSALLHFRCKPAGLKCLAAVSSDMPQKKDWRQKHGASQLCNARTKSRSNLAKVVLRTAFRIPVSGSPFFQENVTPSKSKDPPSAVSCEISALFSSGAVQTSFIKFSPVITQVKNRLARS
jgi:hypothetical protein